MSYTNKTTNLELPQYIGTDIPSILTDVNGAYSKIDTAYGEQNNNITEAVQNAEQAKSLASAAQAQAQAASNEVSSLTNRVKTVETAIESVEEVATNAQSTANTAKTTAESANAKATTASSAASVAQSTANTANNNASNAITNINNMKSGAGGVVASAVAALYKYNNKYYNVSGTSGRILYNIETVPAYGNLAYGIFLSDFIIDTSLMNSTTVGTIDLYPICMISGNIFGSHENSVALCGYCPLLNATTKAFSKSLTLYLWTTDNVTYLGVYGLSASDNGLLIDTVQFNVQISE